MIERNKSEMINNKCFLCKMNFHCSFTFIEGSDENYCINNKWKQGNVEINVRI